MQSTGPLVDLCCELLKFPNLIEHYQERAEGTEITFADFLDSHYGDQTSSTKHEDDHDGKLPFQGNHSCVHGFAFIFSKSFEFVAVNNSEEQNKINFYRTSGSTASLDRIFQPPQV